MRPRKYHVELTETERKELNDLTNKGKVSAIKIKHAQILLICFVLFFMGLKIF